MRLFKLNTNNKRYLFISNTLETEEVSVLGIIKYLLSFWLPIVLFGVVFGVIGILSSNSPIFYTSKSVIIPDGATPPTQNVPVSLEELLAPSATSSSAGIESFPGIAKSRSFLFSLLEEPILSESHGGYIQLKEYLLGLDNTTKVSRTIGKIKRLPSNFISIFKRKDEVLDDVVLGSQGMEGVSDDDRVGSKRQIPTDSLYVITAEQIGLAAVLSGQIKVGGLGNISIVTELPEAKMSTRLNNLVLDKLVEETVRIQTAKQQRDLKFAILQRDTAKMKFERSQDILAQFNDQNKGKQSAKVQATIQRLSSEYSLYFGIYSELAVKVEMLKIELLENTPFYEVLEQAYIPLTSDGGFSASPIIKNLIIGIALGILWAIAYTGLVVFRILRDKLSDTAFDRISD